jgi:hypothetical protein
MPRRRRWPLEYASSCRQRYLRFVTSFTCDQFFNEVLKRSARRIVVEAVECVAYACVAWRWTMSAPEREALGPLKYVVGWAQVLPPSAAADDRRLPAPAASDGYIPAPGAPDAGMREPPWKRRDAPARFEGDVAITEPRARLALSPDQISEPVLRRARGAALTWVGRLTCIVVLAAGGALTLLWLSARQGEAPGHSFDLISYGQPASPNLQVAAASAKSDLARAPQSTLPRPVDRLSRPAAGNERHPGRDLTTSAASPAAGQDHPDHVDLPHATEMQDAARLSRLPPPAAAVPSFTEAIRDRNAIAALVARGGKYFAAGDVAAARLVLRPAALAGDSVAALTLGETYDPGGIEAARRHRLIGRPGAGPRLVSQGRGVGLRRRAPTARAACQTVRSVAANRSVSDNGGGQNARGELRLVP